jgi:VWFA-related protein
VSRFLSLALAFVVASLASTAAWQSGPAAVPQRPPSPSETRPADQPIFRLTVSLVQLDAVVTDRKGRHVTTLGPEDFEVYQDGHPQPITAVSYVETGETWHDTSGLPPLPPEALQPNESRRYMAIVVDDLRMSFESIYYARRGLQKFVDRGFQPGDMATLVTTSGGYGRSSEFTYSPTVLKSAIGRLRYSLLGIRPASAFDTVDGTSRLFGMGNNFLERTFAASAIARVEDAIAALKPLPGRKSVILVSEGFSVFGFGMDNELVRAAMQQLVDRANRAGVVVYALDPRGLVVTSPTAADSGSSPQFMAHLSSTRSSALRDSQDGLRYLAGETGGFAVVNTNDLAYGMRRIMSDQRGYYLIGYQPEAGTLAADSSGRFRHVKLKVRRKGLRVRTRSGFYAVATER